MSITKYSMEDFGTQGTILIPHPGGNLVKVGELIDWLKSKTGQEPKWVVRELKVMLRGGLDEG